MGLEKFPKKVVKDIDTNDMSVCRLTNAQDMMYLRSKIAYLGDEADHGLSKNELWNYFFNFLSKF